MTMNIPSRIDGDPLQTVRLPDGRRQLLEDLTITLDGEQITVPAGFKTDFSSYPRFLLLLLLAVVVYFIDINYETVKYEYLLFFLILLIPLFSRVDIAGVVHDYLYYVGSHSKWRADGIWYKVAISGDHHAFRLQAIVSWMGLVTFGWVIWCKHRTRDKYRRKRKTETFR
ncbi:MAG: hypothetical protein GKR96_14490 [Gammaproteobacteria bacterium]|nr:hypothetical protein [Gammaproteobacteria bacterium]